MSMPMSPVRVNAVVTLPGTCYNGDQSLRFEWEVFSQKNDFMSSEATDDARPPPQGVYPCRLGRELVIPQESLKPGIHNVSLNVCLGDATELSAIATSTFEVTAESLVPVIRNDEVMVETNAVTYLIRMILMYWDRRVTMVVRTNGRVMCRKRSILQRN